MSQRPRIPALGALVCALVVPFVASCGSSGVSAPAAAPTLAYGQIVSTLDSSGESVCDQGLTEAGSAMHILELSSNGCDNPISDGLIHIYIYGSPGEARSQVSATKGTVYADGWVTGSIGIMLDVAKGSGAETEIDGALNGIAHRIY